MARLVGSKHLLYLIERPFELVQSLHESSVVLATRFVCLDVHERPFRPWRIGIVVLSVCCNGFRLIPYLLLLFADRPVSGARWDSHVFSSRKHLCAVVLRQNSTVPITIAILF
uniref:(northern house mosquito) hypothetical protein n=2 Tax=Culex pipiens TaxID=7175 RepID=A0A8D8GNI0_CULPI